MRKMIRSGFDEHLQHILATKPKVAKEYARQFAELPLTLQLGILRRRQWLTQEALARKLKVKQPHVARTESPNHDPRISSVENQAKALRCHVMLVPDAVLLKVAQLVVAGRQGA